MGEIVFGVRDDKVGVRHSIVPVAGPCLVSRRNSSSLLDRLNISFVSREAGKMSVEIVQPLTQLCRGVPRGIGGDKHELDVISHAGGQFLQSYANIGHVHGALIGTIGVAEKEQRDRPLGSFPKIKRSTGRVSENKFRFRQGRRDEPAPIRVAVALLRWRQTRENEE